MILWVRNSGRAHWGCLFVPCRLDGGASARRPKVTSSTSGPWCCQLGEAPLFPSKCSLFPCGHTSFSYLVFLDGGCLPRSKRDYVPSVSLYSAGQSKSKGQHGVKGLENRFHSFVKIILFIFGCARCSSLRQCFSSYGKRRLLSNCSARASHRGDFSCCRAQALGHSGFSSCGM